MINITGLTRFLVAVVALVFSAYSYAADVSRVVIDGKAYRLSLPEGYCDQTKTEDGAYLLNMLKDILRDNKMAPKPVIVFRPCGWVSPIPWGYVGYQKMKIPFTQEQVNRMRKKFYANPPKWIESIIDEGVEGAHKKMRTYGVEIEETLGSDPVVLWDDENSIISMMLTTTKTSDGMSETEKLINSSTVLDGLMIDYMIYDDKGLGGVNTKKTVLDLANTARIIKKLN